MTLQAWSDMLIASWKQFQLTLVLEDIYFKSLQTQFTLRLNASKHEKTSSISMACHTARLTKHSLCPNFKQTALLWQAMLNKNSKINAYYPRVSHKSSGVPRMHPSGQWKICRRTLLTSDYLPNPSMFLQRYQLLATYTWKVRNTGGSKSTHRIHNSKLPIHYANL